MTAADRVDAALGRIDAVWQRLGAEATVPREPDVEHPWGPWSDTDHGVVRFCTADGCLAVQARTDTPTPPHVITRAAVLDLLRALGLEPTNVRQVVIEPTRITVTEKRLDDAGRPLVAGNEMATVTTTIGIQ